LIPRAVRHIPQKRKTRSWWYRRRHRREQPDFGGRFPPADIDTVDGSLGIYVMLRDDGIVKIGVSRNPFKRMRTLQGTTGHQVRLRFFRRHRQALEIERRAHFLLRQHWYVGEWFRTELNWALATVEHLLNELTENL
jgi:hypothetical protein